MKRQSLFLLFYALLSCIAYGKTDFGEMLRDGTVWYYEGYDTDESYYISDTKSINGKTYGQLHIERHYYDGAKARGFEDPDWLRATIGIRDEGGRIFVNKEEYLGLLTEDYCWSIVGEGEPLPYEETPDGELVLYDFNKNVGDVYCQFTDGTSLTVTNVSVLKTEDGILHRRLTLSNGMDLIEGVGCTNSSGYLLFWLNTQPHCREKMKNLGLLTIYGFWKEDGAFARILARDFNATINELNGRPNKMLTQGRRWVYDYDNGEMKGTLTYTVEGDTLLYAYKRAKVYMTLTDNETKKVVRSGYIGAFNEMREYLCYLAPDSLEATQLYNFSVCYQHLFECNGISRDVVNDDSIMVGNEKLHRIQLLNRKQLEPFPLEKDSLYYWVEGIGSSKGLLEYCAGTLMDSIQFVGCYDGDVCFFTKEDFEKEGNQPSKFCTSLHIGLLSYNIYLGPKTATVIWSDDYKTMSSITIPSSVELWGIKCAVNQINDNLFKGLTELTSVELPESMERIGDGAFYDCIGLTSIRIPEGVSTIGKETFRGCTGLHFVSLPSGLTSIGFASFLKCKELSSITFPETLTSIGANAFQDCSGFTMIDIPSSTNTIGKYAFSKCPNLTHVYCRATTPPCREKLFLSIDPEATLHVPSESLELYKRTFPWNEFKYIVPIEDTNAIVPTKDKNTNGSLFDFQGRRLNAEPKHGVYIRNGKKVVK